MDVGYLLNADIITYRVSDHYFTSKQEQNRWLEFYMIFAEMDSAFRDIFMNILRGAGRCPQCGSHNVCIYYFQYSPDIGNIGICYACRLKFIAD